MAKARKKQRKSRPLVLGYLERISSKVFSGFPGELTGLVGRQHGVYALYKGDRLYYVGLATNLRGRIKGHLKDKHKGKWDKFSLYLVRAADHIRELESLILRVADPRGNVTQGRLRRAENLHASLVEKVKRTQKKQLEDLGLSRRGGRKARKQQGKAKSTRRPGAAGREPALAP